MAMALEGIKILDLSRMPPGLFTSMMLGDLGASVLKIDALSGEGDDVAVDRSEAEKRETAFDSLNRNKRGIALNLKNEGGRKVFYRLCETADVILEGFRPGVVERLEVDFATVSKINPRIVYCSISGFGQDGPYRLLPGHDLNYIAVAGALDMFGEPARPPVPPMNLVGDYAGGSLHAVIGIQAALWARQTTGRGQYVDISITDGAAQLLAAHSRAYFRDGFVPDRGGARASARDPDYTTYQTKDGGYITLGCIEPVFWRNLCHEIDREDFIPDQMASGSRRDEIKTFLTELFQTRTKDEWFDRMWKKNIPIAKVNSFREAVEDPQFKHRQMVVEIDDPELGPVKQIGIAIKLSETPGKVRVLGPAFGEHTDAVLSELGYGADEVSALRAVGAVG